MEKSWKLNKQMCGGGALLDPGIHLIDLAMLISNNTLSLISLKKKLLVYPILLYVTKL